MTRTMENQAVAIQNLTWDSNASKQNVEKAAQKITSAIEKNTDKITAAVKTGTDKVAEATRKVANESGDIQTVPVTAVIQGLQGVAVATAEISDYLRRNPTALGEVAESGRAICKQFSDLIDNTANFADGGKRLREVAESTKSATDWIGGKYHEEQSVPVNNAFGRMSDFT